MKPPPDYAPTVGLDTTWWVPGAGHKAAPTPDPGPPEPTAPPTPAPGFDLTAFADHLGQLITETPEERRTRLTTEREAAFKASGETAEQRKARHKAEAKAAKRAATRKAQAKEDSGRARRFRRWCTLTALSASAGYATGLVQLIAPGGPYVGLLLAAFGYGLDLRLRDWGGTRVAEVRRPLALAVLIVVRIPVASGLTVALGAQDLITAVNGTFH